MKPISVLITVVCLLAAACGGSDPEPMAVETPAAEATPTPRTTPVPTPSPTPEPTLLLIQRVCPDDRTNPGLEYSYDPSASSAAAMLENCGPVRLTWAVCDPNRENPGLEYAWDPDETSFDGAVEANCGPVVLVSAVCPDEYDLAGTGYEYNKTETSDRDARLLHCGTLAPVDEICPDNRQRAGDYYFYDPDDMDARTAREMYCGLADWEVEQRRRTLLRSCTLLDDTVQEQVKKGTRSIRGNCYFMGVHVYQFDANTGPCSFLGSFSRFDNRGFSEDRLAQYGYSDDPDLHWLIDDCPDLDDVFAGDNIVVDAVFTGPYTYETTGGFFKTVPAFEILRVR